MMENPHIIQGLGFPLDEWNHKSCTAEVGVGEDWATIYLIQSDEQGQGHCTELLLMMKEYYEGKGLRFGGSVALNERMRRRYVACGITEYA